MIEAVVAQLAGHSGEIGGVHRHLDPVVEGVHPRQVGVGCLSLDADERESLYPRAETKRRSAHATPQIEHAFAVMRRDGGGEKDRIDPGAVPVTRLHEQQLPAQELVFGQIGAGKPHAIPPCTRCRYP